MQPIYCSACGRQNASDAKFCNECAKPLFYTPPIQAQPAEQSSSVTKKPENLGAYWATQTKESKLILGGVAVIAVLVFIALLSGERPPKTDWEPSQKPAAITAPEPPPARTELNAQVRFTGTQFIIKNNESVDLTNVKMEINGGIFSGGYQLMHDRMKANDTYTVGAMQFADSDGKRFNPFQMKPQKFTISADTSIGHLFYVGGWN